VVIVPFVKILTVFEEGKMIPPKNRNNKFKAGILPVLSLFLLALSSCADISKEVGSGSKSDVEVREGITGTEQNPAVLDPFTKYEMVMTGGECRYLVMKIPSRWYWKAFITAADRDETQKGHLEAEIAQGNPAWAPLPGTLFKKDFNLNRGEGDQAVLAAGNSGPDRLALLKLCQDGAPLIVTLQSEISATGALLAPDVNGLATPTPEP
jgi:hypothetical protein